MLFGFGSDVVLLTVAVFETVAPGRAVTSTLTVIVAEPPALSVPSEQLTVPVLPGDGAVPEPTLVVTEENVAPDGIGSLTLTFDAALGPLLATVNV